VIRTSCALCGLVLSQTVIHAALPTSPTDLFQLEKVWSVHLQFEADQWKAIEPKDSGRGMFGGGPRGPGRGGPGGPGGFNPARFMAPVWLGALDGNADGKVTQPEMQAAFAKWATDWDTTKRGYLVTNDITDGLNKSLAFDGPGGPGGPGGRGGMNLQGRDGGRNGLSAAQGITFEYVHGSLEFEGARFADVAARYKGNGTFMGSRMQDKKSFKVDLNEFVKGQKLAGISKLNLHNNVTDASWMNEPLSYALYRDAGVPAPRSSYARVSLSAAGSHTNRYLGLYSIVENPDNQWAEFNFHTKKGAIFKPVTREPFKYLGDDWAKYQQTYDAKTDLTADQKQRLIEFCKLVTDADDTEFARRLPDFLDVDQFARFFAVTTWLSTMDSILAVGQNYIVYLHPKTGRFIFAPWDLDHSFGQFGMQGSQEEREQLSIEHPWNGDIRFFDRVMAVPAVKEAYLARMKEFQDTLFQPARIAAQVDRVAKVIRDAVKDEDADKLARFDKVVAGESVSPPPFGGGPRPEGQRGPGGPGGPGGGGFGGPPGGGPGGGRGGFGQPAKPIKAFIQVRHDSVAAQLSGKSKGERVGGMGGGRGRGGFGPGTFVGPAVTNQADEDKNGQVTAKEMAALADRWWTTWNPEKADAITQDQIAEGLTKIFPPPPGFGPPGL
jgi:spore coat protein H